MIKLVLLGLASWRLASMIVDESGPANMFGRARSLIGADQPGEIPDGSLKELFTCIWCASAWSAIALISIYRYSRWPIEVLASSAIAILVKEWIDSGRKSR